MFLSLDIFKVPFLLRRLALSIIGSGKVVTKMLSIERMKPKVAYSLVIFPREDYWVITSMRTARAKIGVISCIKQIRRLISLPLRLFEILNCWRLRYVNILTDYWKSP